MHFHLSKRSSLKWDLQQFIMSYFTDVQIYVLLLGSQRMRSSELNLLLFVFFLANLLRSLIIVIKVDRTVHNVQ